MKKIIAYIVVILVIAAFAAYFIFGGMGGSQPPPPPPPASSIPLFQTNIAEGSSSHPHDTASFTEGFVFYKGYIYESTGLNGKSKLLKINPANWQIEKQVSLDEKYFGEGIAILHDSIYQLTYQEHAVFVYDLNLIKRREMYFDTDTHEGWGMTTDGQNLIVSDGSSNLQVFDPSNFKLIKRIPVTEDGYPVAKVNELEMINGYIYANQWFSDWIFKIDPGTGAIIAKSDVSTIRNQTVQNNQEAVTNGIAYDSSSKKIYITGKNWPSLYEVKFQ